MKRKIYISGRITGDENYRAKFQNAQESLESLGCIVLNPANLPAGLSRADYMRINFSMIDSADMVVLLTDWRESEGAKLEYQYCKYIGKPMKRFCDAQGEI